jgi:hypothetical protein
MPSPERIFFSAFNCLLSMSRFFLVAACSTRTGASRLSANPDPDGMNA